MTASASCLYPVLHLGRIILQYLDHGSFGGRIHRIFARDLILPNRVSSCTRPNSSHRRDSQTYRLRCRLRGMLASEALANIMWATATLRKENVPWFAFFTCFFLGISTLSVN